MKTLLNFLSIALVIPGTALAADTIDYRVKGEGNALAICKAVIADDTVKLDKKLEQAHKKDRIKNMYLQQHSAVLLDDFSCNGKSLQQFAENIGAQKVVRYLDGYESGNPRIYIDDVAAN